MQNNRENSKKDLKERTYKYVLKIIEIINKLPNDITSQIIAKQLIRSATSIGANIIEAQSSSSKREFTKFISYSLKSANESKYWLELLKDSKKVNGELIEPLLQETVEIGNILGSSILTLKGKKTF